ncbi:MAG: hypothetical protein ACRDYE_04140, partial [Acidimicrobiales bacterium]
MHGDARSEVGVSDGPLVISDGGQARAELGQGPEAQPGVELPAPDTVPEGGQRVGFEAGPCAQSWT